MSGREFSRHATLPWQNFVKVTICYILMTFLCITICNFLLHFQNISPNLSQKMSSESRFFLFLAKYLICHRIKLLKVTFFCKDSRNFLSKYAIKCGEIKKILLLQRNFSCAISNFSPLLTDKLPSHVTIFYLFIVTISRNVATLIKKSVKRHATAHKWL